MIEKGVYKHYKGGYYEVIDVVTHSETYEEMVLYRPQYGEMKLWVRPINMFKENVSINEEEIPRFKFIK